MDKTRLGKEEVKLGSSPYDISIETPYDDLIPQVSDSAVQFYLDAMRIYLGLCSGSVTMEDALRAVEKLRNNPEFTISPTNPTVVPINEQYRQKMIENLKTIKKFNLFSVSALRSAYNFVFLVDEAPINDTDLAVLTTLSKDPLISLVDASKLLNLTPRTVARSLDRLRERNNLRTSCLVDFGAFNLQSVMLFFTLQKGIDWEPIEQGLSRYPFTKTLLRTAMTDVGYATFLIPNIKESMPEFMKSIKAAAKSLFDYSSIHVQTQSGATSDLSLYRDNAWELPRGLENMLKSDSPTDSEEYAPLLDSSDPKPIFNLEDFLVAAESQMDARAPPSKLSELLKIQGIDIDSKRISTIARKLQSRNLMLPYLYFGLPGLSSNFCFEIICNDYWKSRILLTLNKFPWTMYYLSTRGIVVWILTPGNHQVEYYQLFRALEHKPGVSSIQSIMTISHRGSKSMYDLTRDLQYIDGQWSIEPGNLDIGDFIDY